MLKWKKITWAVNFKYGKKELSYGNISKTTKIYENLSHSAWKKAKKDHKEENLLRGGANKSRNKLEAEGKNKIKNTNKQITNKRAH